MPTLVHFHCCFTVIVPSQVTGVTVSRAVRSGRPALRVTWTTPQSDVSISRYQVQYRRSGTTSWSSAAPVLGSTISTYLEELVAGTEYQVRVRAVSTIGNGIWSEVQSETIYQSELSTDIVNLQKINYTCIYDMDKESAQSLRQGVSSILNTAKPLKKQFKQGTTQSSKEPTRGQQHRHPTS